MKAKEILSFKCRFEKAEDSGDTGYLEGYASTFGNVDQGMDVVDQGAFSKTIKDKGGVFAMLLDHDETVPAGFMMDTEENDKGLKFRGEVLLHDPRVKQRYELAKRSVALGAPMGLSIGYRAIKYDFQAIKGESQMIARHLKEIQLYETSIVTFPMNELATVTGAKAQAFLTLFERLQKQGYDLEKIENALKAIGSDQAKPSAADLPSDPELLQSVDKLLRVMRS